MKTQETIEKQRESLKNHFENMSEGTRKNLPGTFQKGEAHPGYGKERTEEVKNKISEKTSSEIVYAGIKYSSVKDASEKLNLGEEGIRSKLNREKDNPDYKFLNKRINTRDYTKEMKPVLFAGISYKSLTEAAQAIGKTQTRAKQIMTKEISAGNPSYKYL